MSNEKSGLKKAAAILGAIFLISLGLCGANFVVVANGNNYPGALLMSTGFLELLGMAVGAIGLAIVGVIAIVRKVRDVSSQKNSDSISIIEKDKEE